MKYLEISGRTVKDDLVRNFSITINSIVYIESSNYRQYNSVIVLNNGDRVMSYHYKEKIKRMIRDVEK